MEDPVIQLTDGTMLIDASVSLKDLKEDHNLQFPESPEYDTLGGFLLATLQKIPKVGDQVVIEEKRISIMEMVGQRIAKVKIEKISPAIKEKTMS